MFYGRVPLKGESSLTSEAILAKRHISIISNLSVSLRTYDEDSAVSLRNDSHTQRFVEQQGQRLGLSEFSLLRLFHIITDLERD